MPNPRDAFIGRWRITSTDDWEAVDEAYIEFDADNGGYLRFGTISADVDYRVTADEDGEIIEWSWFGSDEGETAAGRGWAVRDGDTLSGRIFIHRGDDSVFDASLDQRRPAARSSSVSH